MFFGSVQKISRLDSQSKFQMIRLFTGRHIGIPIFMKTTGNESARISLITVSRELLVCTISYDDYDIT